MSMCGDQTASGPPGRAEMSIPAWVWGVLAAVTLGRILLLVASPAELYPDEAQYWRWAHDLDWGYYSKPPVIAWLIWISTGIFGDGEWAVRLAAPLCHAVAAAALILTGRRLYGAWAGALAGALYLFMPGVALSSVVISTDAPLLAAWSAGLAAFFALRERPSAGWAIALGAAVGLGFLAKYAMIYALIAGFGAALIDVRTRAALLTRFGALAGAVAGILIAPNLIWNARHDMATLTHTADNASWDRDLFNPGELLDFLTGQLGVFGPVAFVLLIAALVRACRGRSETEARILALFVLTPLVVVSVQAFISRANANWAAAAYPAAAVLLAGWLLAPRPARARTWRIVIGLTLAANLALVAPITAGFASFAAADAMGGTRSVKWVRGWSELSAEILDAAEAGGFDTIAFDDRFQFHALDYYGAQGPDAPRLTMWRRYDHPASFAETCCALTPETAGPVLLVSRFADYRPWLEADFEMLTPLGEIVIDLGPGQERRVALYAADGYRPVGPREGKTPPE